MGQAGGRPNRTLKLEGYQKMTAEADEEKCTEDAVEKYNQKLKAIWGMADLRNGFLHEQTLHYDPPAAERLTALYTIRLQELLVCQECLLETKKDSNMLMLPLPMIDFDSCQIWTLEDSLRSFFATERLTDDSACCCERCDRRTSCLQGESMKVRALPQTLTLHLKRFCSKRGNSTRKISHSLSFPKSLDFSQILTPEQFHSDALEKVEFLFAC
ncbi:hypothetical protein lerEdw1_018240 [Lerista edwardsae]|nr:hypothetical protein lerEdw1_018240 [Lerista edwardsae]